MHAELAKKLAEVLGDVVVLRSLVQGYHWNVKGIEFSQLHDFFATIYEDLDGSVDPLAENIRKINYDAPYFLTDFIELSSVPPQERITGDSMRMLGSLLESNEVVIGCLKEAFRAANECGEDGIADFLAGRIDMHQKWQWQLRAHLAQ